MATIKKKKTSKKRTIIGTIIVVAVILVAFFMITKFVGRPAVVSGSSMEPTLREGDLLYIDKRAYLEKDPERFDLIVFPYSNDENYIKRIIAMPGETVYIKDGYIYINGTKVKEYYGVEKMLNSDTNEVVRLAEDEYYVLGDNRNASADSRDIGPVKSEQITGKVVFRLWPINAFGSMKGQ